jgi:hypothetical protein
LLFEQTIISISSLSSLIFFSSLSFPILRVAIEFRWTAPLEPIRFISLRFPCAREMATNLRRLSALSAPKVYELFV